MATFAAAVTERNRIMEGYPGVTATVRPSGGAFDVSIHDVRPSEAKTAAQIALLLSAAEPSNSTGESTAWTTPLTPAAIQADYP